MEYKRYEGSERSEGRGERGEESERSWERGGWGEKMRETFSIFLCSMLLTRLLAVHPPMVLMSNAE